MCRLFLMTIACLLILFGFSGLWMMPKLIQQKIEKRMELKINTKAYDRFTKIPIPLTVKFYLFNVTNSERVLLGLERPQFQEVGPFMYKQWRRREIVDFEDYNRKLRYREIKTFYSMFQQNNSNSDNNISRNNCDTKNNNKNNNKNITTPINSLNEQDLLSKTTQNVSNIVMLDPNSVNVTVINLPLLSVLTKLAQLEDGSIKKNLAAKVASRLIVDGQDKILITRPANQLLFDGYKVDFMESARDLISGTLGFNFESPLPRNMFGFFYMKNATWSKKEAGELTVSTGRNDSMKDFMIVDNWNDQKQLNVWPTNTEAGNRCNEIIGTDGSQFHPGTNKHQVLSIFSPFICTSIYIKYKEDTQTKGIPLLRFTTPAEIFAAPKKNARNACYCTNASPKAPISENQSVLSSSVQQQQKINDSRCYIDGLMDLSLCQRGAPIAASSPHFYNADPMLAMVAGLKPNKEIHETYIDIEPMTGSVFRAASRAQLNAFVEQAALDVVDNSIIGNMTPMVAPLLWLEEAGEIDEKSSLEFKSQLLNLVDKARHTFIYSIIVGIIIALVVSIQYWYVTCYRIDTEIKNIHKSAGKTLLNKSKDRLGSRSQLHANIRLGEGARKSNLAIKQKSTILSMDADLVLSSSTFDPMIPVTATGTNTGSSSRYARDKRRAAAKRTRYNDGDDEELRKRMLVAHEWDQAITRNANSSGHSSEGTENQTRQGDRDLEQSSSEGESNDKQQRSSKQDKN